MASKKTENSPKEAATKFDAISKASVSESPSPQKQAITERQLDGKIIWIERDAYNHVFSDKQEVRTWAIQKATFSEKALSFVCSSDGFEYQVKLLRLKDTNFQGKIYCYFDGEQMEYSLNLQVYENRLGLFLEGDWDEGARVTFYCFVHLYYL